MDMTSLNISLPDNLKEYLDHRVEEGGYGTASEYLGQLIREEQLRLAAKRLESDLIEGAESGDPIPARAEFWDERRRALLARYQEKQARKC
jgi:antitoxin ParD1/3/4